MLRAPLHRQARCHTRHPHDEAMPYTAHSTIQHHAVQSHAAPASHHQHEPSARATNGALRAARPSARANGGAPSITGENGAVVSAMARRGVVASLRAAGELLCAAAEVRDAGCRVQCWLLGPACWLPAPHGPFHSSLAGGGRAKVLVQGTTSDRRHVRVIRVCMSEQHSVGALPRYTRACVLATPRACRGHASYGTICGVVLMRGWTHPCPSLCTVRRVACRTHDTGMVPLPYALWSAACAF
jgi:hypothetical protein